MDGHEWQRRFIPTLICCPVLLLLTPKEHLLRLVRDGLRRVYLIFPSFDGPNICAVLGSTTSCGRLANAAEMQKCRRHLQTGTTSKTVNPQMTSYVTFDPVGGHFLHLFTTLKYCSSTLWTLGGSSIVPAGFQSLGNLFLVHQGLICAPAPHGAAGAGVSKKTLHHWRPCSDNRASSSLRDSSSLICLHRKSRISIENDVEKLSEGPRRPTSKARHLTLSSMLNYFSHKQWPHCRGWGRLHGNRACQPPPGGV